jgi:hypothetical protein
MKVISATLVILIGAMTLLLSSIFVRPSDTQTYLNLGAGIVALLGLSFWIREMNKD